jgi:periplasmic nitrate reductase NapD
LALSAIRWPANQLIMPQLFIASCIARAHPHNMVVVQTGIDAIDRCSVEASDGKNKLVVLVEGASTAQLLDSVDQIRAITGVLSVDLVYQHAEDAALMNDVMDGEPTCQSIQ